MSISRAERDGRIRSSADLAPVPSFGRPPLPGRLPVEARPPGRAWRRVTTAPRARDAASSWNVLCDRGRKLGVLDDE